MTDLLNDVSITFKALIALERSVKASTHVAEYGQILAHIGSLRQVLEDTFDPGRIGNQRKALRVCSLVPASRNRYQKRKREELRQQLLAELGPKLGHRIRNMWLIRAGLGSPNIPAQTLQEWLTSFPVTETQHISATYIGCARDGLCECIKYLNRKSVGDYVDSIVCGKGADGITTVCIGHIHDEAPMRMRYHAPIQDPILAATFGSQTLRRGRSSKVQDHAVHVYLGDWSEIWYTELQALLKKDGPTTALSIVRAIGEVLELLSKSTEGAGRGSIRVVHVMTADGVGTNENAAKRTYQHFHQRFRSVKFIYFLVIWRCASHLANLAVAVAVCGHNIKNPRADSPL